MATTTLATLTKENLKHVEAFAENVRGFPKVKRGPGSVGGSSAASSQRDPQKGQRELHTLVAATWKEFQAAQPGQLEGKLCGWWIRWGYCPHFAPKKGRAKCPCGGMTGHPISLRGAMRKKCRMYEMGRCAFGSACLKMHPDICPDFASGKCRRKARCGLAHMRRT